MVSQWRFPAWLKFAKWIVPVWFFLFWAGATFDSLPLKNLPPLPIGDKTPDPALKSKVSAQIQRLPLRFEVNAGQTDAQVKFLARGVNHGLFLTPDGATLTLTARTDDARLTQRRQDANARENSLPLSGGGGEGVNVSDRYPHPALPSVRGKVQYAPSGGDASSHRLAARTDSISSFPRKRESTQQTPGQTLDPRVRGDDEKQEGAFIGASVRMRLVGANPNPRMIGEDELAAKSHYFIGNDPSKWHSNVANFGHVRYREVYPGIDLLFYGNDQNSLEYDFVVSPGADPKLIEVAFEGGDEVKLNESGDIVIKTPAGDVIQHAPVIYQCSPHGQCRDSASLSREQENAPVASAGQMRKSSSNNHPHLVPLPEGEEAHINPSLSPTGALTERRGRGERDNHPLPRAGEGRGEGGPSSLGERKFIEGHFLQRASNRFAFALGDYDASQPLVIDPGLIYSSFLGGASADVARAIAMDSSGYVYVTGFTTSADFPAKPGGYSTTCRSCSSATDIFVTKLNTATGLNYSTFLGGAEEDKAYAIAVDSSGNAYVAGNTASTDFPTTSGAYNTSSIGKGDVFAVKLNSTGAGLSYSTYLGGTAEDKALALAVDSGGSAYVTGVTQSANFPVTSGAFGTSLIGTSDAFVTKLNSGGTGLTYSTYLGGSKDEQANGIAVDSGGSAYVTGVTQSANFPVTSGAIGTSLIGTSDAFVTKLNSSGTALTFSTYLGGTDDEQANAIAVDSGGSAYVTGKTNSTNFPVTSGVYATNCRSCSSKTDAFVTKLNSGGTGLTYSTYLGGMDDDQAYGIAVDSGGNAYVAGETTSTDFPAVSDDAHAKECRSCTASPDAFVAKFNSSGSGLVFSSYLGGSSADKAWAIAADSSGNIYLAGETASADFPITSTAYARTCRSCTATADAFLARFEVGTAAGSVSVPASAFGAAGSKVISPYWQAGSGIYSLIAVSHPSLSGLASQIGVAVYAVNKDGNTLYGAAAEFTLTPSVTKQVVIAPANHVTLNSFSLPNAGFISGTTSASHGHLIMSPVATNSATCPVSIANHCGFRDITQLSYWGAVVLQNTATGFAMEFLGDLHDSVDTGAVSPTQTQGGVGLN